MMTLTLMKQFFDIRGPKGEGSLADQIVTPWFPTGANVGLWRASANFVFKVRGGDRDWFLRFNHASERDGPLIEAECRFLAHLAGRGVRVNMPTPSAAGRLVESVETKMGLFHAVLFDAVGGKHREIEDLDLSDFQSWGTLISEIHAASQGYVTDGRPSWAHLAAGAREWLDDAEATALAELDRVEQIVGSQSFTSATYGLIHYDLELDNILWDQRQGVVDFDDCAYYPFAADIAFALRDLWDDCAARIDFGDERLLAFVRGYREVHALDESELRALPLYLRLHDLTMFAKLIRSLGRPTPDAEEWVDKLRAKLEGVLARKRKEFGGHGRRKDD